MVELELETGEILGLLTRCSVWTRSLIFIARVTYRTTKQGGRTGFAKSGYRPQLKFEFTEMQTSGQHIFINKKAVYPGEIVEAWLGKIITDQDDFLSLAYAHP